MRLEKKNSIFNMGDTSIRVKQTVEVNKIILSQLYKFMQPGVIWEANKETQENFYRSFIDEIVKIEKNDGVDLFSDFQREKNYTTPNENKKGLRARTLTNALVKSGLINFERKLSEVGNNYLHNQLSASDDVEKLLSLSKDNLVYLRQYLKLRIYSYNTDYFFYNFRFAIKFLTEYSDVPQRDFFAILLSVRPEQSNQELNFIINDYKRVKNDLIKFENFYIEHFKTIIRSEEELNEVEKIFDQKDFSDDNFITYFPNAKSSKTSLLYKDFVLAILQFKKEPTESNLQILTKLARNNKIKKAFSYNRLPFNLKANITSSEFIDLNRGNRLLSDNIFNIYLEFIFSKHLDLVREYSDTCRRAFQNTGIISFENQLVNLNNRWLWKPLLDICGDKFTLAGIDSYTNYEEESNSKWFKDLSTMQILEISSEDYNKLEQAISKHFNEDNVNNISHIILEEREKEFRNFVDEKFPRKKVIKILNDIYHRNDSHVYKQVTDNATISTIYEYILTIAWFHISKNKDYYLHQSFGVSLDGNKLPLSHQVAGKGDIEIITKDYALLIEATLMNSATQRRGELEPVIRHSVNFSIANNKKDSQTIFIANDLDQNVLNIFRSTQFMELKGTLKSKKIVRGLNIFAFTTKELIKILKKDITDQQIITVINSNLETTPVIIRNHWRNTIVEQLFNNKQELQ